MQIILIVWLNKGGIYRAYSRKYGYKIVSESFKETILETQH
jgi:hypothetical protein